MNWLIVAIICAAIGLGALIFGMTATAPLDLLYRDSKQQFWNKFWSWTAFIGVILGFFLALFAAGK